MNFLYSAMVVLAIAGCVSIVGLIVDFLRFHSKHRNIRMDSAWQIGFKNNPPQEKR
jgi:hypothetical protein